MSNPILRDPATAVAASICWLYRWRGGLGPGAGKTVSERHPQPCGFCEYPAHVLGSAIAEFVAWGGLREADYYDPFDPPVSNLRHEVESFARLPQEHQRHLVAKRQGYVEGGEDDSEGDRGPRRTRDPRGDSEPSVGDHPGLGGPPEGDTDHHR